MTHWAYRSRLYYSFHLAPMGTVLCIHKTKNWIEHYFDHVIMFSVITLKDGRVVGHRVMTKMFGTGAFPMQKCERLYTYFDYSIFVCNCVIIWNVDNATCHLSKLKIYNLKRLIIIHLWEIESKCVKRVTETHQWKWQNLEPRSLSLGLFVRGICLCSITVIGSKWRLDIFE